MNICVCIKQVPDVTASLQTGRMVLNAYDASAVEEALVLTESGGGSVDLVSIGTASSRETIRKALAMGADAATHIPVTDGVELDSAASAHLLASYFQGKTYDLILCGKQSQDTDSGLTGGMLAEHLSLPYATNAVALRVEDGFVTVTRQADSGQEIIALPFPCLVTCSNDMNNPRIPSLKGIMQAKRKEIVEMEAVQEPATSVRVLRLEDVPDRSPGEMLSGEQDELVDLLITKLTNEARVL